MHIYGACGYFEFQPSLSLPIATQCQPGRSRKTTSEGSNTPRQISDSNHKITEEMDQDDSMGQTNVTGGTEGGGGVAAGGGDFVKLRVLSQDGNEVQFR